MAYQDQLMHSKLELGEIGACTVCGNVGSARIDPEYEMLEVLCDDCYYELLESVKSEGADK